jgi:hypothetical protein
MLWCDAQDRPADSFGRRTVAARNGQSLTAMIHDALRQFLARAAGRDRSASVGSGRDRQAVGVTR